MALPKISDWGPVRIRFLDGRCLDADHIEVTEAATERIIPRVTRIELEMGGPGYVCAATLIGHDKHGTVVRSPLRRVDHLEIGPCPEPT